MTSPHLDADTLAAYVDGRLAAIELGEIDRHIDACGSCRQELSSLASLSTQPGGDVPSGQLGRYRVDRELGAGAMGVVLRAYDPELARPVAIKLVREDDGTRDLVRAEARALAKLRHPNVVTVYDVIADDDRLYIAMELVEGATLRGYARGRALREVLAACVRAGRGLAAAHAAGVIHRDFKPDNVLCGDDGDVRVSDFGLAATVDAVGAEVCGTPAYMAPEVKRGEPATVASDQYSFCVATYEMLVGERPGGDAGASKLPAWIARPLARGLSIDPAARFASLAALLDELDRDPAARRRRAAWLAGGTLAAAVSAIVAVRIAAPAAASCAIDPSALGDAWTTQREAAAHGALAAVAGNQLADKVIASVDGYAAAWLASRRDACAGHERGGQDDASYAQRVACLDRGRRQLAELARVLATADAHVASVAGEAVGKLPDPTACALPARDDVVTRVLFAQDRAALDRANALQLLGKHDDADALIDPVVARAGTPQLLADALVARARVALDRGRHARAEATLFDALTAAERAGDDSLIAAIWVDLVMTNAQQQRFELAMTEARAADAALARVVPGVELQARYEYTLGGMLLAHGEAAAARTHFANAVALAGDDGLRQVQAGLSRVSLCDAERQLGHLAEAHAQCKRGMDLLVTALGTDHLRVAIAYNTRAVLAFSSHELDEAQAMYEHAIDTFERIHAPDHLVYALALSNLGALYATRDDNDKARAYFERARDVFAQHYPTHPQRLMPIQGLASLALRTGDAAHAIDYYTQVRDVSITTYAADSPQVLAADFNLALAYRDAKQPARAQALLDELVAHALVPGKESWMLAARALDSAAALADDRKAYPDAIALRERALVALGHVDDPATRAMIQRQLGESHRYAKQYDLALPPLEESLAYYERHADDAYDLGVARYAVGVTLARAGLDKPRAIALLTGALEALDQAKTGEHLAIYRKDAAILLAHIPR